jgi:hypothetical protein
MSGKSCDDLKGDFMKAMKVVNITMASLIKTPGGSDPKLNSTLNAASTLGSDITVAARAKNCEGRWLDGP